MRAALPNADTPAADPHSAGRLAVRRLGAGRWSSLGLVILAAFALAAAACGDPAVDEADPDQDRQDQTGDNQAGGGANGGEVTRDPDDPHDTDGANNGASGDRGGTAGIDRSGEIIRVGYVNNEGGVISLPEMRIGGEVAIALINESGGIHGAIIEPVVCLSDGTPEGAINCATKLIEQDIVLAYMGVELASEAAIDLWIDAGIPYISSHSWGPTERNSPGAFLLHASFGAFAVGPAKTFTELGIDHIGVIIQDAPTAVDFLDNIIAPILSHYGITMERIVVQSAAPDWTAAIAAAQAADVGAIMGHLDELGCIGMVGSAAASGFDRPIFASSCMAYVEVLGPAAAGTYAQGDIWSPATAQFAPPQIQARLAEFENQMTAAGHASLIHGFAAAPYSAWREMQFILETIDGPITTESVTDAFANAGETPGWFGPNLQCGLAPWPPEPSHCGAQIMVWQVVEREDGTLGRVPQGEGFFNAFEHSGL